MNGIIYASILSRTPVFCSNVGDGHCRCYHLRDNLQIYLQFLLHNNHGCSEEIKYRGVRMSFWRSHKHLGYCILEMIAHIFLPLVFESKSSGCILYSDRCVRPDLYNLIDTGHIVFGGSCFPEKTVIGVVGNSAADKRSSAP